MISKLAVVETENIGKNVTISEFCVIRDNVKIGNNVTIHPNVVIYQGVEINDDVEIFSGAVIGKKPKKMISLARTPQFKNIVIIGKGTSIGVHAVIYYDVQIGSHTLIGDGANIREQCVIGNSSLIGRYATINYNVKIGNKTKLMSYANISGNCEIGDNVFIGVGVITPNDNKIIDREYNQNVKSANIENDVSIGSGAIILPNLNIGKGSLIGAGAVVTKNTKQYEQVMGVPAKHVRFIEYK